jgi:AcrR family transcriptional regulator
MTTQVRRGRPRDESLDAAILDATVEELIARGFIGLSIEAVAARAGVAKTTLYRRWPNTTELALDAMRGFDAPVVDPPDGPVRDQLIWLLDGMRRKWGDPRYAAMMRRVVGDAVERPEAYRDARDRLILPHVRALNAVLERARDDGLLARDTDVEWLRQLLTAPILASALTLRRRVTRAQVEANVDVVLRGAAP